MVRERDALGIGLRERFVARLARGGFETLPLSLYLHLVNPERHAEPAAKSAAERRPRVRVRAKTVMHVERRDAGDVAQLVQQDYRVDAAREGDGRAWTSARPLP
jgi:hypothetical protein